MMEIENVGLENLNIAWWLSVYSACTREGHKEGKMEGMKEGWILVSCSWCCDSNTLTKTMPGRKGFFQLTVQGYYVHHSREVN